MKQWYEELFENYARQYDQQPYVKGTRGEVDFIEREIGFDKNVHILDVGCGTGRHAIELAKRGYSVTGVDLSEAQLARARRHAREAGVNVQFLQADARRLDYQAQFDLVIMLCEGAFALMETDEMNFAILQNASNALKEGGVFIFNSLNGLFPLFHSVKDYINQHSDSDITHANTFDLMTFRDYSEYDHVDDDGNRKTLRCNQRFYVPSEITWLLKSLGLSDIEFFSADMGNWNRDRKLTIEDFEMLVISKKRHASGN